MNIGDFVFYKGRADGILSGVYVVGIAMGKIYAVNNNRVTDVGFIRFTKDRQILHMKEIENKIDELLDKLNR